MIKAVLSAYGLNSENYSLAPLGTGLINQTWVVNNLFHEPAFVLQRINTNVFKNPHAIAQNISLIENYLTKNFPNYLLVAPLKTKKGELLFYAVGDGYYRLTSYVTNSHSADVAATPRQAFEAAKQFGRFTKLLSGFNCNQLQITLADFHNLSLRYNQFERAVANAKPGRLNQASELISFIRSQKDIAYTFETIKNNPAFKLRTTHHDTKISNVLFSDSDNALCIVDLDTVMPGYFISDVGDMMRTYLSPASEEEKDFSKITIREDYFEAVVKGYISEMKEILTESEKKHFVFAGKFLIYMQAIRFLTDFLNNDVYYAAQYPGHNLLRAENQCVLLKKLIEKEVFFNSLIRDFFYPNVL
ncbi:MAG TPA: phosphotransferase [Chitinophagaceae bacterium]|nr:phosphotransferase [Chitinophagaceae bacterium]